MLEMRRVSLGQAAEDEDVTTTPILVQRGFVAVPTPDVEAYVHSQFITFAGGFVIGMSAGAIFGNLFARRRR